MGANNMLKYSKIFRKRISNTNKIERTKKKMDNKRNKIEKPKNCKHVYICIIIRISKLIDDDNDLTFSVFF